MPGCRRAGALDAVVSCCFDSPVALAGDRSSARGDGSGAAADATGSSEAANTSDSRLASGETPLVLARSSAPQGPKDARRAMPSKDHSECHTAAHTAACAGAVSRGGVTRLFDSKIASSDVLIWRDIDMKSGAAAPHPGPGW